MPAIVERPKKRASVRPRREELTTDLAELEAKLAEIQEKIREIKATESPKVILAELHAGNGRIDAGKVADFLCIPLKQLVNGLGLSYKNVHRDPSGASFQEALQPVKRTLEYLQQFFQKPEIIRAWLNTPHPLLDGKTSLETILEGKAFATERLLGNAWEGVWS